MKRQLLVMAGLAFTLAISAGCGPSGRQSEKVPSGDPGKPTPQPDRPESTASGMKAGGSDSGGSTKDKVYRTADGLFADMPKEVYPKAGSAVENTKASKWLKESFKGGQVVEWETKVTDVKDSGTGPFHVVLKFDVPWASVHGVSGKDLNNYGIEVWRLGGPLSLGEQRCLVGMAASTRFARLPATYSRDGGVGPSIEYRDCTEEEVARLKALKDQKVVVRGTIASKTTATRTSLDTGKPDNEEFGGAALAAGGVSSRDFSEDTTDWVAIVFFVHDLSVEGFTRKAGSATNRK